NARPGTRSRRAPAARGRHSRSGAPPRTRASSRPVAALSRASTGSFSGMAVVGIDAATGSLLVGGTKVFPIVLSNGPPPASVAPNGRNGLAEVAGAGVGFLRTGTGNWSPEFVAGQIQNERTLLDAAG